jgi:hypothetical protein
MSYIKAGVEPTWCMGVVWPTLRNQPTSSYTLDRYEKKVLGADHATRIRSAMAYLVEMKRISVARHDLLRVRLVARSHVHGVPTW